MHFSDQTAHNILGINSLLERISNTDSKKRDFHYSQNALSLFTAINLLDPDAKLAYLNSHFVGTISAAYHWLNDCLGYVAKELSSKLEQCNSESRESLSWPYKQIEYQDSTKALGQIEMAKALYNLPDEFHAFFNSQDSENAKLELASRIAILSEVIIGFALSEIICINAGGIRDPRAPILHKAQVQKLLQWLTNNGPSNEHLNSISQQFEHEIKVENGEAADLRGLARTGLTVSTLQDLRNKFVMKSSALAGMLGTDFTARDLREFEQFYDQSRDKYAKAGRCIILDKNLLNEHYQVLQDFDAAFKRCARELVTKYLADYLSKKQAKIIQTYGESYHSIYDSLRTRCNEKLNKGELDSWALNPEKVPNNLY